MMTDEQSQLERFRQAVDNWLWGRNPRELTFLQRILLRQLQTVVLVFRDFSHNQCMMRASSLTYYTMLSLVPLLALVFTLLKAFGVQNLIQPLIVEKLNVGDGRVVDAILAYINNTQVAQLGVFGLIFLVIAVVSLLTNVEKNFNDIWGVKDVRPVLRRFADYLTIVLVGPVLLIAAISSTSTLLSNRMLQKLFEMQWVGDLLVLLLKVSPFVFMWLAFTALYVFMSNIRVDWRAAFFGGVVGGTLWQLAQLGYVHFQLGVGRYNAIYGTMAAVPVFMVWLYLSWVIVLFGLGVCYVKQNLRTSGRDLRSSEISRRDFVQVALILLMTLAQRFQSGQAPLSLEELSRLLYLPPRLCRSIMGVLQKVGFVTELTSRSGRCRYQLGRSAENLSVAAIYDALDNHGESLLHLYPHPQTRIAHELAGQVAVAVGEAAGQATLRDLVASLGDQNLMSDTQE